MGDAGFCFLGDEVEDGGAGCFGAGAGGGGDGDEREERFGDGQTAAKGGVDEVEELIFREAGVKVHEFGRVNYAAASYGEECAWLVGFGEIDCF